VSFLDAFFTSTSAVCVTGLVVVDTGTHFTKFGQFVVIALIQIGGLGIMTMSTLFAMILGKKIGLKERILIQESFNQFSLAGLVRLIRNVLIVTLTFEGIGGLILSIRFLADFPPGRAIAFGFFHSVSAFCNAGFDIFGQVYGPFTSITHYVSDWTVNLVIGIDCFWWAWISGDCRVGKVQAYPKAVPPFQGSDQNDGYPDSSGNGTHFGDGTDQPEDSRRIKFFGEDSELAFSVHHAAYCRI
jgi:hypothetical protein